MVTDRVIRVLVWNENVHERTEPEVRERYPDGIHGAVADGVRGDLGDRAEVTTATLDLPEHGLPEETLAATDVLVWWGHVAHDQVADEVVDRVRRHVLGGMGLVVLHSGHFSKIFRALLGTTCSLRWRDSGDRELVWTVKPGYRGHGRIFYFSPGDQAYPVYHLPDVRTVIANAVAWAAPELGSRSMPELRHSPTGWYTGEAGT